jgi:hypothetical protein
MTIEYMDAGRDKEKQILAASVKQHQKATWSWRKLFFVAMLLP